ncbi:MAG: ORF6N domain-containing protein [Fibrobacter sp.]|nr:ORF6N domain-containing protein [Fibrobacter sp.]
MKQGKKKASPTDDSSEVGVITEDLLKGKIFTVRSVKVMLDSDLAEIYGYSTKRFNEQVKANIERFDSDFRFQLTVEEFRNLRSEKTTSSWGGQRYVPHAYTEQGIYMLMTVLKGDLAIRQSKALIRLFKEMKDYIVAENQQLLGKGNLVQLTMQTVRQQTERNTQEIREIRTDLQKVMDNFVNPSTFKHFLFLDGQKFEADMAYVQIYGQAQNSVYFVDDYVGVKTLDLLRGVSRGIKIVIFSEQRSGRAITEQMLNDFCEARPDLEIVIKPNGGVFHDRYIFMDYGQKTEKFYHCGTSSKDAGSKVTTIMQILDKEGYYPLIERVNKAPV